MGIKIQINIKDSSLYIIEKIPDKKLEEFIKAYNGSIKTTVDAEYINISIAWHNKTDLFKSIDSKYDFGQKQFISEFENECFEEKHPIIHITPFDIHFSIEPTIKEKKIIDATARYSRIMDCSIWNFYAPIEIGCNGNYIFDRLKNAISSIISHNKRYTLKIAIELADLNARLVGQSYLCGGEHSSYVSPFVFHSEKQTKDRLLKRLTKHNILDKEGTLNDVKPFSSQSKWRILLLDDHANIPMRQINSEKGSQQSCELNVESVTNVVASDILNDNSKLKIIIDDILTDIPNTLIVWSCPTEIQLKKVQEINNNPKCKEKQCDLDWRDTSNTKIEYNKYDEGQNKTKLIDKFNIAITCVRDVKSAIEMLKYAKYDIILLDYLLDKKIDKKGKRTGAREYSYELLEQIHNEQESKSNNRISVGPMDRLYFMYISAYSSAIAERLNEQGLIYNTKYWHIGKGACPTNTPKLFMYYLISLMERRYSDMTFDHSNEIEGNTVIHLLQALFKDGNRQVKRLANIHFNTLLTLRGKYNLMKTDVFKGEFDNGNLLQRRGSLLVYSMFPDIQYYSNSFWEHLQHLVYLVAFGNIRQWSEMWDEYIFIRENLIKADKSKEPVHFKIEAYIISIKTANYK